MNETIYALFSTILATDGIPARKLYKDMTDFSEYSDRLKSFCEKYGLDIEQENAIDEIAMDLSYLSERHGFEQGLTLGFKLAAEILAAKC